MTALFFKVFAEQPAAAKTISICKAGIAPSHDEITSKVVSIMIGAIFIVSAIAAVLIFSKKSK